MATQCSIFQRIFAILTIFHSIGFCAIFTNFFTSFPRKKYLRIVSIGLNRYKMNGFFVLVFDFTSFVKWTMLLTRQLLQQWNTIMHAVWSTVRIQNVSFRHDISWQLGVRKCFVPILTNVFDDNAFFAIRSIDFLTHPKDVSHSIRIDDRCTVMSTIDNNDKNENDHRHIELSFSHRTNAAAASLLSVRKHAHTQCAATVKRFHFILKYSKIQQENVRKKSQRAIKCTMREKADKRYRGERMIYLSKPIHRCLLYKLHTI